MKKLYHKECFCLTIPKFYLKMKFTLLFLTATLFQVQANSGYSQKISLDLKQVRLVKIFEEIESKTDYNFFYKNEDINENKKLSVSVKNKKVKDILKNILKDTNLSFSLLNKQIIIQKKLLSDAAPIKKVSAPLKFQVINIEGKVTDENGDPLPGAAIKVKGKNIGASTGVDGAFSLAIPDGSVTLVISFVGYKTLEVEVGDKLFLDIQLEYDIAALGEIVVVGYGTVKKQDLTGAVGVVKIKNITNQAPTVNLDYALQGQVSGVQVTSATGQPGAASRVRIRGTTSLLGSNQPLYVIDGIPVITNSNIPIGGTEGQNLGEQLARQGISTPLGNINSADIESISVLKDASAAAIYGSRAANGVIIINTKQGKFDQTPVFNVDYSISTQKANTLDVLNAAQFREAWTTAVENGSSNDTFAQNVLDGSYFGEGDTNWEDELSPNNPITTNFNIGVYGGAAKSRYNVSIGINSQDGVFDGASFDRYSINLGMDTEVNSIWKLGSKINLSYADQRSVDGGITQRLYNFRPDLDVYDSLGKFSASPTFNSENPVALSGAGSSNQTLLLLSSFFTELKLAEGLHLRTTLAVNYNNGTQESYYPKSTFRGGWRRFSGDGDGFAQESRSTSVNTLWQNSLTYNKSFDSHSINAVLGASFEKSTASNTKGWGEGFDNETLTNITSATVFTNASSFASGSGLASYFGRVNYNYNDKYILNLSARVDGSSKFAPDNKYAFFPAVGVAWNMSNESFLENSRIVGQLKLRVSAGTTGQQEFGDYAWRTLFVTSFYGGDPAIISSQLGNSKLQWETTNQFDIGTDFMLFKGRLWGEINYYVKNTQGALFSAITPGSTGSRTITANIGNTSNTGVEVELAGDVIIKNDFSWNLSMNITKNSNKLTKITDDFLDEDGFITGFRGGGRLKEGSPIGLIYGYVSEGIFQTQEEIDALNTMEGGVTTYYQDDETAPGDLKFRDITGPDGVPDGRITNLDQQVIGDTQADFFGGIGSTWSYKGFSLNAFFTYSIGNDIQAFSLARDTNFATTFIGENKTDAVFDAWTPENPSSDNPRIVYRDPNNNDRTSSQYVFDASYLRLKTLSLSYAFSSEFIEKAKYINSLSLLVSAQNLATFTKYPGADPEASNLFNNDISAGRDNNRFPIAKTFTIGVRLGF